MPITALGDARTLKEIQADYRAVRNLIFIAVRNSERRREALHEKMRQAGLKRNPVTGKKL
jgi:hypothetical protein